MAIKTHEYLILAFETSCDDTAVALYSSLNGLLAHKIFSQFETHQKYGGVVPELASRDHLAKILPLTLEVLEQAGQKLPPNSCTNLSLEAITHIAYTKGPGLLGALLVGASFAKTLSFVLKIPAIGINHMEGHIFAPSLESELELPFLSLLISGGHSILVEVIALGEYKILGQSLDDAVGEAFDKCAKLLGLPMPGGRNLENLAAQHQGDLYPFPTPMVRHKTLNMSFSGLKTAVLNQVIASRQEFGENLPAQELAKIAKSFQTAAIETLYFKVRKALKLTSHRRLIISGGVSANTYLRQRFLSLQAETGVEIMYPRFEFCTDNAAMIAVACAKRLEAGIWADENFADEEVKVRFSLEDL